MNDSFVKDKFNLRHIPSIMKAWKVTLRAEEMTKTNSNNNNNNSNGNNKTYSFHLWKWFYFAGKSAVSVFSSISQINHGIHCFLTLLERFRVHEEAQVHEQCERTEQTQGPAMFWMLYRRPVYSTSLHTELRKAFYYETVGREDVIKPLDLKRIRCVPYALQSATLKFMHIGDNLQHPNRWAGMMAYEEVISVIFIDDSFIPSLIPISPHALLDYFWSRSSHAPVVCTLQLILIDKARGHLSVVVWKITSCIVFHASCTVPPGGEWSFVHLCAIYPEFLQGSCKSKYCWRSCVAVRVFAWHLGEDVRVVRQTVVQWGGCSCSYLLLRCG
eukprot:gene9896-20586_t